jgi:hypothetical protein
VPVLAGDVNSDQGNTGPPAYRLDGCSLRGLPE